MSELTFEDQEAALRFRDLIRRISEKQINKLRPDIRIGRVFSYHDPTMTAQVLFPGNTVDELVPVRYAMNMMPSRSMDATFEADGYAAEGNTVRVAGSGANLYIADYVTHSPRVSVTLEIDYEPEIDAGLSTQYWRGDKVWTTLDIAAVSGLTAALSGKEPTLTAGTTAQYYRGDKSWQTLDKTAVGLGNVANVLQFSLSNLPAFGNITGVTTLAQMPASGTSAHYMRGDKSWQTLDKTAVGLGNVANVLQFSLSNLPAFGNITGVTTLAQMPASGTSGQYMRGDKTWQTLDVASVSGLVTALAGKEPTIASGTSGQYWDGTKTWQSMLFSNIVGVIDNTQLPERLSSGCKIVTDWNDATETGFYIGAAYASNNPGPGDITVGYVLAMGGGNDLIQKVGIQFNNSTTDSQMWERRRVLGTWGGWQRLMEYQTEMDTRYILNPSSYSSSAAWIGGDALPHPLSSIAFSMLDTSSVIQDQQLPFRLRDAGQYQVTNFNTHQTPGFFYTSSSGAGVSNTPTAEATTWQCWAIGSSSTSKTQYAQALVSGEMYRRRQQASVWGSWERMYQTTSEMDARYPSPTPLALQNDIYLNNKIMYFKGDTGHGIRWLTGIDGVDIFGWTGGQLRTNNGNIVGLTWAGNLVTIPGHLNVTGTGWLRPGAGGGPVWTSGWADNNVAAEAVVMKRVGNTVKVRGVAWRTSGSSLVMFTLPVGCRPTRTSYRPALISGTWAYVSISTNGDVSVSASGTAVVNSTNGIGFEFEFDIDQPA